MVEAVSLFSLVIGGFLVIYAVNCFLKAKFSALSTGALGLGGLVWIDVFKYKVLDSSRVGEISEELFLTTFSMILLSSIVLLLAYRVGLSTMRRSSVKREFDLSALPKRIRIAGFVLIPISCLAFVSDGSGYAGLVVGVIRGFAVGLACYAVYYRERRFLIVAIVALVISTLGESSRRSFISIFLPIGIAVAVSYRNRNAGVSFVNRLKFLALIVFGFVFLNFLRSGHDFGEDFKQDDPIANTIYYAKNLTSIDTFHNAAFIIDNFPDGWRYFLGETYLSVLVAPIPRSLWPDKPVSLGAPLGLMHRYGVRDFDDDLWQKANMFSLSPSFVGEAYANGGWAVVVLVSILLGYSMAAFDAKVTRNGLCMKNIHWQVFISSFILVHRGDFYTAVNFQVAMFFGLIFFLRYFFARRNPEKMSSLVAPIRKTHF